MTDSTEFNWLSILIAALLIVIPATVINVLVTLVYGFYIGFQSRGDNELITQQVTAFSQSIPYLLIISLVFGLLVWWRGSAFAQRMAPNAAMTHIAIATAIALVINLVLGLVVGTALNLVIMQVLMQTIAAAIAIYASTNAGSAASA